MDEFLKLGYTFQYDEWGYKVFFEGILVASRYEEIYTLNKRLKKCKIQINKTSAMVAACTDAIARNLVIVDE